MAGEPKRALYERVRNEASAVLDGETNVVARMATLSCLLHEAIERSIWTGFYVVDPLRPDELVVGPYQGSLGCLRIPFGKGVCGAAAARREVQIVADVHAFPGHIACDSRSNSEIVLPVLDKAGALIAVLDIDSAEFGAFDETDAEGLVLILEDAFAR